MKSEKKNTHTRASRGANKQTAAEPPRVCTSRQCYGNSSRMYARTQTPRTTASSSGRTYYYILCIQGVPTSVATCPEIMKIIRLCLVFFFFTRLSRAVIEFDFLVKELVKMLFFWYYFRKILRFYFSERLIVLFSWWFLTIFIFLFLVSRKLVYDLILIEFNDLMLSNIQ